MKYEELCKLDAERTQGEWRAVEPHGAIAGWPHYSVMPVNDAGSMSKEDCQFIAAAPEMMATLKKYREALESVEVKMRDAMDGKMGGLNVLDLYKIAREALDD